MINEVNSSKKLSVKIMPSENKKQDNRRNKFIPEQLKSSMPLVAYIVGPRGSGKSSMLYSMLDEWLKGYYHLIIIFTGTADSVHAFEQLQDKKTSVLVYTNYTNQLLEDLYNVIKDLQEERRKNKKSEYHVCMVFDDMLAKFSGKSYGGILNELYFNSRHEKIDIIFTSQKYRAMNQSTRADQVNLLILMKNLSKMDIKAIEEEHGGSLEKGMLTQMYYDATDKSKYKHGYLTIKKNEPPLEQFYAPTINDKIDIIIDN